MVAHAGWVFYPLLDCLIYSLAGLAAIIAATTLETQLRAVVRIQRIRLDGFDPASMDHTVQGSNLAHVQLSAGAFHGHLVNAQIGRQRLDYGHYNLPLLARGDMPGDRITLGLVLRNPNTASVNGHIIDGQALVVFRENEPIDYRLSPGTEWMAFQITRESLVQLGMDPANLPQTPIDAAKLTQLRPTQHAIRAAIATLSEIDLGLFPITAPEKLVDQVFSDVIDEFQALFDAASRSNAKHPGRRAADLYLVRQAMAYIDTHLSETLQVGELCQELKATWRTLDRAFLRLLGVPPKRYIRMARLAEARRLLLQYRRTGRSIADVASACGINHLGRFSQVYRSTYGELPSQTLRR